MPETTTSQPTSEYAAKLIERPGYARVVKEANRAASCYYGGDSLLPYITKYSAGEDNDKFQWRQAKIIENFENYTQEISQQYIEGVAGAGTIVRETKDNILDAKLKDSYAIWFEEEFMPMALMLPEIYVQICKDPATSEVRSKQDALDQKLMPYTTLVFPQFVQNFCCDREKNMQWITIRNGENFEIWDNESTVTINKEGKVIIPKQLHGFKKCPFIRVTWRENKAVEGQPKPGYAFMFNITMQTLSLLTWIGQLQESALFHLYPKLVWSEDTKKKTQAQGGIGVDTPITEAATPDQGPGTRYLTMPGTEIETLERVTFDRKQASIYRTARLRDRSTEKSQSGISKMMDMIPEVSILKSIARFISRYDKHIITFMAEAWIETLKPEQVSVTYPKTFDNKSVTEVMQQVASYQALMDESSLPSSPTAQRILSKKVTIAQLGDLTDLTDELRKQIEKEIDDAPIEEVLPAIPPSQTEPPIKGKKPIVTE